MKPTPTPANGEAIKARWDERASRYDAWYLTFKGAVEHHVDWALLQRHLPTKPGATILDAAGGTGRLTVPLAQLGYSVTLCDISPGMLAAARRKLCAGGVADRVRIVECDLAQPLPLSDHGHDFVVCWGGGSKALAELTRVAKRGAPISLCASTRTGTALGKFARQPDHALKLLSCAVDHDDDCGESYRVVSEDELRDMLDEAGIEVIAIYATDLWTALALPEQLLESRDWDARFFAQTTDLLLRMAEEPSVRGLSRHLTVVGRCVSS